MRTSSKLRILSAEPPQLGDVLARIAAIDSAETGPTGCEVYLLAIELAEKALLSTQYQRWLSQFRQSAGLRGIDLLASPKLAPVPASKTITPPNLAGLSYSTSLLLSVRLFQTPQGLGG